jgi:hypothetical protein
MDAAWCAHSSRVSPPAQTDLFDTRGRTTAIEQDKAE